MRVIIETHSPQWKQLFDLEKETLKSVLGNRGIIEHIGSTAIEGMDAKPVIDIMIGLTNFAEAGAYIQSIVQIGYTYISAYEDVMPYRRFFIKEKDGVRTHHIHMVERATEFLDRHLAFRDCLRNNTLERDAYYELKKELSAKEWKDGNDYDYAAAKTNFIRGVEKKIQNQRHYMQPAETSRLSIRPLSSNDANDWLPFFINNPADIFLALSFNKEPINEQAHAWIERQLLRYKENRYGLLALTYKATGNLAGMCGLLSQEVNGQSELEIGYHLLPAYWGKGLATEAAIHFKRYAFDHNLTDSVISIIHVDNILSQRVAEKNGMSKTIYTTYYNMPVCIYRATKN